MFKTTIQDSRDVSDIIITNFFKVVNAFICIAPLLAHFVISYYLFIKTTMVIYLHTMVRILR